MNLKLFPYSIYDNTMEDIERKTKVFQILNSLKKYDNLDERLQKTVEYVVKYFNAYFFIRELAYCFPITGHRLNHKFLILQVKRKGNLFPVFD